jgi:hypothetical protein
MSMATKKFKKSGRKSKLKLKHAFRNRASPVREATSPSAKGNTSAVTLSPDGRRTLLTAGGALGALVGCAYAAKNDWLPPLAVTGAMSAVGAALAVFGGTPTVQALGTGAMAAAGGQLGLMLIDDHNHKKAETKDSGPLLAKKKESNADGLPPGALEAAYERARARLAMAQAGEFAA